MNVYEIVTQKVLDALKGGIIPWRRPWRTSGLGFNAMNLEGKSYRGINAFLLAMEKMARGFSSDVWLTYRKAKQGGGHVKGGAKGSLVIFWKMQEEKDEDGEFVKDEKGRIKVFPILRYYTVFNLDQTEGVKLPKRTAEIVERMKPKEDAKEFDPIAEAESLVAKKPLGVDVKHGGDRACYRPSEDRIFMPERKSFESGDHYYSTLFHELTHATGHASRLARPGVVNVNGFGSEPYGQEELVAEMGAAMVGAKVGIDIVASGDASNAAYIKNWMETIKADERMVVIAAAQAQKAADMILGTKEAEESEEE